MGSLELPSGRCKGDILQRQTAGKENDHRIASRWRTSHCWCCCCCLFDYALVIVNFNFVRWWEWDLMYFFRCCSVALWRTPAVRGRPTLFFRDGLRWREYERFFEPLSIVLRTNNSRTLITCPRICSRTTKRGSKNGSSHLMMQRAFLGVAALYCGEPPPRTTHPSFFVMDWDGGNGSSNPSQSCENKF